MVSENIKHALKQLRDIGDFNNASSAFNIPPGLNKIKYTINGGDFTVCGTVFNADHIRAVSYIEIINKYSILINLFGFFSEIKNNHVIYVSGIDKALPKIKQALAVCCLDKNLKSQNSIVKCLINQDGKIKIEHITENKSAQYYQISGYLNIKKYPCWVED